MIIKLELFPDELKDFKNILNDLSTVLTMEILKQIEEQEQLQEIK